MTATARAYGRPEMVNRFFGTDAEGGEDKANAYAAELQAMTPASERTWYAHKHGDQWCVVRDRYIAPEKKGKSR